MVKPEELVRYCLSKKKSYIDFPFGSDTACAKVRGKIFAEIFSKEGSQKITLKCDMMLADFYRQQYPGIVVRGYHCPPSHQPYYNTVLVDKMDDDILFDMIDHSYNQVIKSFSKKVQNEIRDGESIIQVIDTFLDFKECFQDSLDLRAEDKINLWENCYIKKYPEIESKCINDYEESGYSWKDIAMTLVFNRTGDDFEKMLKAHTNIRKVLVDIDTKVKEVFGMEPDLCMVLYCGLCNSAGWVDTYNGRRAILFGLDKIAELNWHTIEKVQPLVAHELCHVIHFQIRGKDNLDEEETNLYNKGIWRIYEEGFAQFYQQKLISSETDSRGDGWNENCTINEDKLKELYLKALYDDKEGTKNFFGDWHKVLDISDAGYFLGSKLIHELNERYSMEEIARLKFKDIEYEVMRFLKETGGNE